MAEFKTNDDMFGRYVRIQTNFNKALHIYKVISRLESNMYCNIPILVSSKEVKHEQVVPVLNVIHCGIDESKVIRVALNDCEIVPTDTVKSAADVAPVRHGRWIMLDECSNEGVYCSNCHKKVYKLNYANQKLKSKYCPNCGCEMLEDEA